MNSVEWHAVDSLDDPGGGIFGERAIQPSGGVIDLSLDGLAGGGGVGLPREVTIRLRLAWMNFGIRSIIRELQQRPALFLVQKIPLPKNMAKWPFDDWMRSS